VEAATFQMGIDTATIALGSNVRLAIGLLGFRVGACCFTQAKQSQQPHPQPRLEYFLPLSETVALRGGKSVVGQSTVTEVRQEALNNIESKYHKKEKGNEQACPVRGGTYFLAHPCS
jgi:hypothetical protein